MAAELFIGFFRATRCDACSSLNNTSACVNALQPYHDGDASA